MTIKVTAAAPLITLLFGAIIRAKTGGDKAKIVARAQEFITVLAAVKKINNGDTTGIADLEAAEQNLSALDPSETLAINQLSAWVASKVSAVVSLEDDTLLGQVGSDALDAVGQVMITTCQSYITKYGTPAAALASPSIPIAPATA